MKFNRVLVIVLDSVGVGEMPDAAAYGDAGANTLGHTAAAAGGLTMPHMGRLGLGNLTDVAGVPPVANPAGVVGRAALAAPNKDTTSGHWEMMTCVLPTKLNTFPDGFPPEIIAAFCREAGVDGVLGNCVASGTEVIAAFGDEHIRTGRPIVYTSADSVFQVAAHEEAFGLERLYAVCEAARRILAGPWEVGRVIARPFVGTSGAYKRTSNRHDYSLLPPMPTVCDRLTEAGIPVLGIGKIQDIFAGRGVPRNHKTKDNADGIARTLQALDEEKAGFIFTNLVDFDMVYGHRQDAPGYARCLEEFDAALPSIMAKITERDLLVICADHGNDPTDSHTDHCREYCPVVCWHPRIRGGSIGTRSSLADIGATIAENFGVTPSAGSSFLAHL